MSLFGLRFDLRNPDIAGTTMAERYAAALDMAEWADRLGFEIVCVYSETASGTRSDRVALAAVLAGAHRREFGDRREGSACSP